MRKVNFSLADTSTLNERMSKTLLTFNRSVTLCLPTINKLNAILMENCVTDGGQKEFGLLIRSDEGNEEKIEG